MLIEDDAFEPIVSTFSNVGREPLRPGRLFSSLGATPLLVSVRFAKGFRIGILICKYARLTLRIGKLVRRIGCCNSEKVEGSTR